MCKRNESKSQKYYERTLNLKKLKKRVTKNLPDEVNFVRRTLLYTVCASTFFNVDRLGALCHLHYYRTLNDDKRDLGVMRSAFR